MTEQQPPWGPPTGGWGPPPAAPPGQWAPSTGQWGPLPGWGPPPGEPPKRRSTGQVLGLIGVGAVLVVGVLVGSVTFLGQPSEPRAKRADPPSSRDDDEEEEDDGGPDRFEPDFEVVPMPGDEDGRFETVPIPPVDDGGVPLAAAAMAVLKDRLGDDSWLPTDQVVIRPGETLSPSDCAPDGWLTGTSDGAIGMFGAEDAPSDALTLTLVTYATEDDAAADLERARSPQYQMCEISQRQQVRHLGPLEAHVLPEHPAVPGVAIAMTDSEDLERAEYDVTVVVGRMRAQIDVCSCATIGTAHLHYLSSMVAGVLAEEQGLPAPG